MHVLWFDAHGDFNTPETTTSGFLDGMALAAVTGRCWTGLTRAIPGFTPVPESNVTAIGVRDLDEGEAMASQTCGLTHVAGRSVRADLSQHLSQRLPGSKTPAYVSRGLRTVTVFTPLLSPPMIRRPTRPAGRRGLPSARSLR